MTKSFKNAVCGVFRLVSIFPVDGCVIVHGIGKLRAWRCFRLFDGWVLWVFFLSENSHFGLFLVKKVVLGRNFWF
jgi:hypothetical protein